MADRLWIAQYLAQYFDELSPHEFYRRIFPEGELEKTGVYETGKYTAIACELNYGSSGRKPRVKRHTITDDLKKLDELLASEDFIIMSPISYAGRRRTADNARFMYAMAIDLDGIDKESNLQDLFHQMQKVDYLPIPTYMVWSGTGVHLYYEFVKPVPCFANITKQLAELKQALTRKIWNGYVTSLEDHVQIESLFQGFRLVGGVTKDGGRTRAFVTGEPVTVEYLNSFVQPEKQVTRYAYKSDLTLAEAKRKYPEWYERRIVEGKPRGTWTCKRDLYDWWKRRLVSEIKTGHRYYGVMVLAIYAKKCGIPYEELENDAMGLVDVMERLTNSEDNHFSETDVLCALEMYNDNYYVFSIDAIEKFTDIRIERNKRNGRKQDIHLARIRALQAFDDSTNGTNWRDGNGRKPKQAAVEDWRLKNPEGRKADCIRETGLSKKTVYKYWQK